MSHRSSIRRQRVLHNIFCNPVHDPESPYSRANESWSTSDGVLIAGDDEQALYQQLKQSLPEIIISYYEGEQ